MQRLPRAGFTLIELLVAISIIGILMALLIPAVQSAREAARRTQCRSHLRQLSLALHNYHDAHSVLPPGSLTVGPSFPTLSGWGWGAMVLPQIDQAALYQHIDFEEHSAVGLNRKLIENSIPIWRCPSDPAPVHVTVTAPDDAPVNVASGNYLGVQPLLAGLSSVRLSDVTDGLSSTLLVGEFQNNVPNTNGATATSSWLGFVTFETSYVFTSVPHLEASDVTIPNHGVFLLGTFSSFHTGGTFFAFGDGHVRFVNDSIDKGVYSALGSSNGGEVVSF